MRSPILLLALLALPCGALAEPVVSTRRGEEIMKPDQNRTFNLSQSGVTAGRSFQTDAFKGKRFYISEVTAPKTFQARDFLGGRSANTRAFNLPKMEAAVDAKNQIPNANREAETKTAETRQARDTDKTVSTRGTADADRPFLGPESKRLDRAVDPSKPLPLTMQSGHVMTLEEIRELLNKNK